MRLPSIARERARATPRPLIRGGMGEAATADAPTGWLEMTEGEPTVNQPQQPVRDGKHALNSLCTRTEPDALTK